MLWCAVRSVLSLIVANEDSIPEIGIRTVHFSEANFAYLRRGEAVNQVGTTLELDTVQAMHNEAIRDAVWDQTIPQELSTAD